MPDIAVDIVVPVWNRPVETRSCLVNLIAHSPSARFIIVDNGCDRETESILHEFAERLGERALLMRNDLNSGFVKALNRGLNRSAAPYLAAVRNTSQVSAGWLEPMMELAASREDAGIVVPRLVETGAKKRHRQADSRPAVVTEISTASFAAFFLKKGLFDRIGGFDEEMDGGEWCLKDYSRRAYKAGFLTFAAEGGAVLFQEETPLGSLTRREEALRNSIAKFRASWGDEHFYCIHFPKDTDALMLERKFEILLRGARQGHRFHLLLPAKLYRRMEKGRLFPLHSGITFGQLPLIAPSRGALRSFESLRAQSAECRAVTGIDGMPFPGVDDALSFSGLERMIAETGAGIYGTE